MDIIPAFEAVVGGSNPSGCTKNSVLYNFLMSLEIKFIYIETVDNHVGNVYKGHNFYCLLSNFLLKIAQKIRIF